MDRRVAMPANKRQRGITLIELLIVMVIASVLAMIAVPSYQASVTKSRRADGRVVLNDVAQRLERCYTQFGRYDADDCAIEDGESILSPEGYYLVSVNVPDDGATYVLTAATHGPQTADEKCGDLALDNTGVRSVSGDAEVTDCW
jgi:type IV pilus assembly protein PilE